MNVARIRGVVFTGLLLFACCVGLLSQPGWVYAADRTVVFSTHITSDLERVADRVAILREGRISDFDELDDLKDRVKRIRIRAADDLPESFAVAGALRCEISGRNALVAVTNADPPLLSSLRDQWNADVTVEDLSLEDIFLEMHHDF